MSLPPGQHARTDFPRFGTHLWRRAPDTPDDPAVEVVGAVTEEGGLDGFRSIVALEDVLAGDVLIADRHPRARVWEEERHARLAGHVVRPVYRLLIPPFRFLSALGARPRR